MGYKEENLKSYNKHAKHFEKYFGGLTDIHKLGEFEKFIRLLKGKKILDLGCGAGEHALYFKEQGFDVRCADISEAMISLCKEKGLNAEVMDIENLEFEENSFVGVWAVTSLLHIPKEKMRRVAEKLSEIIKPAGILYVCVKEGEGERFVEDKHDPSTKRFFSYWRREEFLKIFENFFELVEFEKVQPGERFFLQFFLRNRN